MTINKVERGEPVTAQKWNALAGAVNAATQTELSFSVTSRPRSAQIKPFRLRSSWRKEESGVYSANAVFIETGDVFTVYSVAGGSPPDGKLYEWTAYALFNPNKSRWESIQQPSTHVPKYVAGVGISIGVEQSDLGGIPIANTGVTNAQIAGEIRQETNTLYFSPLWFKWIPSSLDIAAKREIAIKAKAIDVVTDVTNGVASKTKILVLVGATD